MESVGSRMFTERPEWYEGTKFAFMMNKTLEKYARETHIHRYTKWRIAGLPFQGLRSSESSRRRRCKPITLLIPSRRAKVGMRASPTKLEVGNSLQVRWAHCADHTDRHVTFPGVHEHLVDSYEHLVDSLYGTHVLRCCGMLPGRQMGLPTEAGHPAGCSNVHR